MRTVCHFPAPCSEGMCGSTSEGSEFDELGLAFAFRILPDMKDILPPISHGPIPLIPGDEYGISIGTLYLDEKGANPTLGVLVGFYIVAVGVVIQSPPFGFPVQPNFLQPFLRNLQGSSLRIAGPPHAIACLLQACKIRQTVPQCDRLLAWYWHEITPPLPGTAAGHLTGEGGRTCTLTSWECLPATTASPF